MGNKAELLHSQYTGSKSLSFLCTLTTLSIDQVNFIACQIFALFLSYALRRWVRDPGHRYKYSLAAGIFICYFCFGILICHVIVSAGMSYFVMRRVKTKSMPWLVMTLSMGYLSYLHLKRQFFEKHEKQYSLDITGPMMVLTQKVTSLAFAISDGQSVNDADQKPTELQKKHAISKVPGLWEFWSYIFLFQAMLAGPLVFFKDYVEFIHSDASPSPFKVVVKKLLASVFFAVMFIKVAPQFKTHRLKDPEFLEATSLFDNIIYITIATTLERSKYYHAWILSDAVCNASGLGYCKATNTWDLVTNVDSIRFELGTNLKESLEQWNIGTMKWLRYVVYERFNPNVRTVVTYGTSAIWHGFYPGYYVTFLTGALFTFCARLIRKTIRPLFLSSNLTKKIYDFLTWFTTRLVVSYVSFCFVLLDFVPSMIVYRRLYFFFHVAAVFVLTILPRVAKSQIKAQQISKITTHDFNNPNGDGVQNGTIGKKSTSFESLGYNGPTMKLKTG